MNRTTGGRTTTSSRTAGTRPGGGRTAPRATRPAAGTAPPRRTDTRRPHPATATASATAAAAAARRRERERLPRYWFAERLLLTLSGQRPVHWMLGHTLGPAYDQLAALAPYAPLRPAPPGRSPAVRHCDEFRPSPGVIEAFARIAAGDRLLALAFRLEHCTDQRWRCSAVELDGTRR
ncbi:Rv3235 family protein [Streptomyces sp. VNUA116]|uniref:Rv3235 family protein n=1 Tax=Streptomyces sp. VNUA116 TaxID=3062449 RepID=UPI0026775E0B|nr:Rv3235 family protein [Streptomyces sp. VNUA116]WKU45122.1 Rv3235 family protein [Streptomyces sp. VNUA116]